MELLDNYGLKNRKELIILKCIEFLRIFMKMIIFISKLLYPTYYIKKLVRKRVVLIVTKIIALK